MNDTVAAVQDAVVKKGWFDSLKEKLNLDGFMEKLKLDRTRVLEIGLYLGIGFLAGFLFKKYAKYLFVVIVTIVTIFILHHLGFLSVAIDWSKVQGIQPITAPVGVSIWTVYWEWVKTNFIILLSFSVGFFVGFKVG